MAAVAHLALLLFAFINNIHSEEEILILKKGRSYTFKPDYKANSSCLISRSVGEEKLVLWNTSDSSSENSTLPDGLKQRLTVSITRGEVSHYRIDNLTPSDSGLYQEECWTDGNMTFQSNTSIIICSRIDESKGFTLGGGDTVDLPCEDEADDLEIQWLMDSEHYLNVGRSPETLWTRVFKDGTTSVVDIVKGGFQVVKKASGPRQSNITTPVIGTFTCLVMNQQQCVSSSPVGVWVPGETIYRSVGETAVLQCNGSSDDKPRWVRYTSSRGREVFQNESLVFSSLALKDSGSYMCQSYYSRIDFDLMVCPKFAPPDVELFSGGENVTIRCIGDFSGGTEFHWFMKSKQTQGRVVHEYKFDENRIVTSGGSVTILNVSLEDAGEYWCAVMDSDGQCLSTAKTLLMYRDPFGVYSTFYTVRCVLFSVLLGVQCVIVLTVLYKTN